MTLINDLTLPIRPNTAPNPEDFALNDGVIKVIDHGDWVRYVPTVDMGISIPNVIFAKRTRDDVDWYKYLQNADNFGKASIMATAQLINNKWRVQSIVMDRSSMFPANLKLLEIRGYNGPLEKVHKNWEQKFYDPFNGTIGDEIVNMDDLHAYAQAQKKLIEEGGITVNGYAVATDRASQAMITQTILSMQINPGMKLNWRGPDGKFTVLDEPSIKYIAIKVITHVATTFEVLAEVSRRIDNGEFGNPQSILTYLKRNINTVY